MPDDPQELRRINWGESFPFTQLFRSFRIAVHPSKLLLALVAIILTYVVGRIMDVIWSRTAVMPPTDVSAIARSGAKPVATTEVRAYIDLRGCKGFREWLDAVQTVRREREAVLLSKIDPEIKPDVARDRAKSGRAEDDIRRAAREARSKAEGVLEDTVYERIKKADKDKREVLFKAYEHVMVGALIGAKGNVTLEQSTASLNVLTKDPKVCGKEEGEVIAKALAAQEVLRELGELEGKGIFGALFEHQRATFHKAIRAVLALDLGIGGSPSAGLKGALVDGLGGVVWLFGAHWFYAVVFTVLLLLIWSLFGGAIARIAALHTARDEKIAIKQALKFSGRKLFSFFFAPLIPVALVCVMGFFLFFGGLVSAIPYVGEVIAAVLWPLALVGGFVIVLVMIGAVTGFMLMFPTVAVEGSDSFDALSRSFSYVYSKPWRTAFYVLVSGFYGAICYLFVRLFAHLMLNVTHVAAGLGMNIDGSSRLPETVGKLSAIWTRTALLEPGRFYGTFGQYPLSGTETFCKWLITFWTFIVVGLVAAFAVSFFLSASTIIYYLLRREVDATDLEDVYLEEYEEEEITAATGAEPTPPAGEPVKEAPKAEAAEPPPPTLSLIHI